MTNNGENTANDVMVDTAKANRILRKVIRKEAENVRTGELSANKMVEFIQKSIEEEVKCY